MKAGDSFGLILLSLAAIVRCVWSTTDDGAIDFQESPITSSKKVEIHGKVVWPGEGRTRTVLLPRLSLG